jgi:hypothetical protein
MVYQGRSESEYIHQPRSGINERNNPEKYKKKVNQCPIPCFFQDFCSGISSSKIFTVFGMIPGRLSVIQYV